MISEEFQSLTYIHIQNIEDAFALVLYLQGFPIVSLAFAHFAGNIYIRQEEHFYLYYSVAVTGFTPSAFDIKAEAPLAVSAYFGLGKLCEEISDMGEYSRICCGLDLGVLPIGFWLMSITLSRYWSPRILLYFRFILGLVHFGSCSLVENFIYQTALSRTRYTRDTYEFAQGNFTSMSFRLFSEAPLTVTFFLEPLRLCSGTLMLRLPLRN